MTDHTLAEAGGILRNGFHDAEDRATRRQFRRALTFLRDGDRAGITRRRSRPARAADTDARWGTAAGSVAADD